MCDCNHRNAIATITFKTEKTITTEEKGCTGQFKHASSIRANNITDVSYITGGIIIAYGTQLLERYLECLVDKVHTISF